MTHLQIENVYVSNSLWSATSVDAQYRSILLESFLDLGKREGGMCFSDMKNIKYYPFDVCTDGFSME